MAVGTLAVGSGAALGTGATDIVRSNNSDSSFRVVAPKSSLTIELFNEGNYNENVEIKDTNMFDSAPDTSELPLIYVSDNDGEMVTVQIAVGLGTTHQFNHLFKVTNNSDQNSQFDIGFEYSYSESLSNYDTIDTSDARKVFKLIHGDQTLVSPDPEDDDASEPANQVGVPTGKSIEIGLKTDTNVPGLTEEFSGNVFGDAKDENRSIELIEEVTARAERTI
ncbi:hypothetical protein [Natrinema sp. H-ect4]|uniref:hypothetical protein n=1 Tax=Natrinema sp. H-ect4 TaxID=3242699 RepID=UPI0035A92D15